MPHTPQRSFLLAKILLTFCALVFGAAVPFLELNATHVFNPHWPAHARLHNAWQLATNSALALLCVWMTWHKGQLRTAATLTLAVTGGFFVAYGLRHVYGGSMLHVDGSQPTLLGLNVGVLGFGITLLLAIIVLAITRDSASQSPPPTPSEGNSP